MVKVDDRIPFLPMRGNGDAYVCCDKDLITTYPRAAGLACTCSHSPATSRLPVIGWSAAGMGKRLLATQRPRDILSVIPMSLRAYLADGRPAEGEPFSRIICEILLSIRIVSLAIRTSASPLATSILDFMIVSGSIIAIAIQYAPRPLGLPTTVSGSALEKAPFFKFCVIGH